VHLRSKNRVLVEKARSRQGRPKDLAKRDAIIAAGIKLFGQQTYDFVTMEAVAIQAGVSKMTVYSHFSDKGSLFETIVLSVSDRYLAVFPEIVSGGGSLSERLSMIGIEFLTVVLSDEVASMARALRMAVHGDQTLGPRFYDAGPGRVRAALTAIIKAAAARGELQVDHAKSAAEDIISLWSGSLPTELSFGIPTPVAPKEIRRRVRRGTELFLRAYATGTESV